MGRYLNPNNNKFRNFLKEKYVVDKSRLLNNILEKMEQNKNFSVAAVRAVLESPSRRRCSWRISAGERIQARFCAVKVCEG